MATWAVTVYKNTVFGDERVVYATLVATGNYTSGGDTVAPSAFGLDIIDFANGSAALPTSTTAFLTTVPTTLPTSGNVKIQLFATGGSSGAALVEPSGSITGTTLLMEVRGV